VRTPFLWLSLTSSPSCRREDGMSEVVKKKRVITAKHAEALRRNGRMPCGPGKRRGWIKGRPRKKPPAEQVWVPTPTPEEQ